MIGLMQHILHGTAFEDHMEATDDPECSSPNSDRGVMLYACDPDASWLPLGFWVKFKMLVINFKAQSWLRSLIYNCLIHPLWSLRMEMFCVSSFKEYHLGKQGSTPHLLQFLLFGMMLPPDIWSLLSFLMFKKITKNLVILPILGNRVIVFWSGTFRFYFLLVWSVLVLFWSFASPVGCILICQIFF